MTTKVALWGFGLMNKVSLKYLLLKQYQLVAVIGHHDVGKDSGEVAGLAPNGVFITHSDQGEEEIQKARPDVVLLATKSMLKDIADTVKLLGRNRVNVITISEEAFYSWNTQPQLTAEIDQIFRDNGVSFTGTGYQDTFWLYIPSVLVGASLKVEKLICHSQYNVEDYGAIVFETHGVGLTAEEFKTKITPDSALPAAWNSNEALAIRLGFKNIIKTTLENEPILAPKDIQTKTQGTIPAGKANGMNAIIRTIAENQEGKQIEIEFNQIGLVYYDDLEDYCRWQSIGTPSLEISCKEPDPVGVTCITPVNRIKGVIDARPGYITVAELGPLA